MCSGAKNRNEKSLKISYWNIHGVKSKITNNKLSDDEFLQNISKSDIVGLAELHTNEEVSLPGYKLMKQKFREKQHKGPKISGGLAVLVKNDLQNSIQVIPNKNEDSIWIKLKQNKCNGHEDIYIGTYYVSPSKAKTPKAIDFFTSLNEEINMFKKKGVVILQGDLNARTGNQKDFVEYDKFDEEMGVENLNNQCLRNSEDGNTNSRGQELLDVCKLNDFLILNGRTIGDVFGSCTSHQWNGSSVVDYVLSPNDFTKNILKFCVGNLVPWLSDHCPLHITILLNKLEVRNENTKREMLSLSPGFIWDKNSKSLFAEGLKATPIKDRIHNLDKNNDIKPISIAAEIKDILLSNAKNCELKTNKKLPKRRATTGTMV